MTHPAHTFHIPVMGTGFTIDTPLHVARYGISSVISLVDDELIEQMREFHAAEAGEEFAPITSKDEDFRARRITAYLNLVNKLVNKQVEALQASSFEDEGSEINRYYRMLPDTPLKQKWAEARQTEDSAKRAVLEEELRRAATPGFIDTNIMTKLDRDVYKGSEKLPPEYSDAMSALRGFANSDVNASIVMSAGLNPRLYTYMAQFDDFFPVNGQPPRKRVVLKVSDYRSAIIQGKFLAKRGIWVSEYRIESGLNCGGHAFASNGALMGPILDEFKHERGSLSQTLHQLYAKQLATMNRAAPEEPLNIRVTVQGGVGTEEEHEFLRQYYEVDCVGWATPFLLVPEVTNVDQAHVDRLVQAEDKDVYLSSSSPLGIPFWNLKNSDSELTRQARIDQGRPGSACPKGYLVSNTDFTKLPICTASAAYQKRRLKQLKNGDTEQSPSAERAQALEEAVLMKSCICHDLAGGATVRHGIDPKAHTAVCCGPNIVNFSKVATLEEMVSHIYGRLSLLTNPDRPHMFLRELKLYIDYLRKEMDLVALDLSNRTPKYFQETFDNLSSGIEYYRKLANNYISSNKQRFLQELERLQSELESLPQGKLLEATSNA